jgi:hypothetical protein
MQDSNTATTTRVGSGARREPVMDRTAAMRVSRSVRATHSHSFPFFPFSFPDHTSLLRRRYPPSEQLRPSSRPCPGRSASLADPSAMRPSSRNLESKEQTQVEEPAEDRRDSDRRDDANWPRHGHIVSLLTRPYASACSHQILKID